MNLEKKENSKKYRLTGIFLPVLILSMVCFIFFTVKTNKVQAQNEGSPYIYDNAGLATGSTSASNVPAPTGFQWSELQENPNNDSNVTLGTACYVTATASFRCADNFTVPTGQSWTINQVVGFAYQTGFAGSTSPFTAANLRIWNGRPGDMGSTIVFGDTTTNRLASSTSASLYRIGNTTGGNGGVGAAATGTTRRIWQNNISVSPALVLDAGNYWVDFQFDSGVANFAPPATIVGMRSLPTWNGRQFVGSTSTWQDSIDIGEPTATPQPNVVPDVSLDFPFKLVGSIQTASRQKPNVDFDGDGKSDFSIIRDQTAGLTGASTSLNRTESARVRQKLLADRRGQNKVPEGAGSGGSLVWYNNNSGNGSSSVTGFGTATSDLIVPADYDGDSKTDLAVWRANSATTGSFFIMDSSTNTMREVMFGQEGDDPQIVGDYDGDGKADVATFRCPPTGGQCTFFYRGTNNNPNGNITYIPWGNDSASFIFPSPGDFDGDGKYDFCIQRRNPDNSNQGQFVLLRSSDFGVEYINWGGPNDFIVPGDFDGDGKSDFMVRRNGSNPFQWYLLERDGGGTGNSPIIWGITGDLIAPGDYDGDGKQDVTVWRADANPDNNYFFVRRSSDMMLQSFEWGSNPTTDAPTANWYVH